MSKAFDEMNGFGGGVREPYRAVAEWLEPQKIDDLKKKRTEAEALFRRTGITFAVYGDGQAAERLIPFDIVPRIISASEWRRLAAGIPQRLPPSLPSRGHRTAQGICASRPDRRHEVWRPER